MAIGNLTTGNSNQMGGLLVVERLPVPLLPFVCQHRLHSAFPPPLANVANGLLGDLQIKSDLGIGEAIIAFEQHPPSRQRARIGFASTDKDLDMASFFFTEAHWSGSSHLFFSFLSSVYHKNPIGLTTSPHSQLQPSFSLHEKHSRPCHSERSEESSATNCSFRLTRDSSLRSE